MEAGSARYSVSNPHQKNKSETIDGCAPPYGGSPDVSAGTYNVHRLLTMYVEAEHVAERGRRQESRRKCKTRDRLVHGPGIKKNETRSPAQDTIHG